MIDSNFIKRSKLSIQNVSRETLDELNKYSLSIICLVFIDFSVPELIRFISLFFFIIDKLYVLSSSKVSRETF